MKKILVAVLVVCMALSLTACSKTKNPVTGYASGDVKLGQYKGITYTPASIEVTEDEVQAKLDSFCNSHKENVSLNKSSIEDGDIVVIDYVGTMDGVAFDGGTASDYELTIGSGQFINGFEDGLIGANIGATVTLNLNFPDPYKNKPEYSGKPVVFDVTVKDIIEKVVPELTDELVAANTDYANIEEYKDSLRADLVESKKSEAESQKEYDIVNSLVENTTYKKDLSTEIANAKSNLSNYYNSTYQTYFGVDAATYFNYVYGMDSATYDQYLQDQAETNAKFTFALSAVVEEEKITAEDAELSAYIASLLENYSDYDTEEALVEAYAKNYGVEDGKSVIIAEYQLEKAKQLVFDSAVADK